MMDNIYIKTDPAGNIKPDKEKAPKESTVLLLRLWLWTVLLDVGIKRNTTRVQRKGAFDNIKAEKACLPIGYRK